MFQFYPDRSSVCIHSSLYPVGNFKPIGTFHTKKNKYYRPFSTGGFSMCNKDLNLKNLLIRI